MPSPFPADFPLQKRIEGFSRGASTGNLLLMLWIFVMAGAFAHSAKQMGSIDATVNLTLSILPGNMLLAGLFLAACFISLSIGTSVGTIVALVPIATGIASSPHGSSIPMITAIVVGGAFFGDNLSFISDTTMAATSTQGCQHERQVPRQPVHRGTCGHRHAHHLHRHGERHRIADEHPQRGIHQGDTLPGGARPGCLG